MVRSVCSVLITELYQLGIELLGEDWAGFHEQKEAFLIYKRLCVYVSS
jgi:hypothetical protein